MLNRGYTVDGVFHGISSHNHGVVCFHIGRFNCPFKENLYCEFDDGLFLRVTWIAVHLEELDFILACCQQSSSGDGTIGSSTQICVRHDLSEVGTDVKDWKIR